MCPKGDCKNNELKHWSVIFTVMEFITVMFQSGDPYTLFTLGIRQTLKKADVSPGAYLQKQLNTQPNADLNTFTHF